MRNGANNTAALLKAIQFQSSGAGGVPSLRRALLGAAPWGAGRVVGPARPGSRAGAFESAVRRDGDPTFHIRERGPGGRLVPAAPRAEYVAIQYVEPPRGNRSPWGFDVASEPHRRAALRRARDTGRPSASTACSPRTRA